jgi:EAL and modified HD-GYP domain-containing signal transduction protein
MMEPITATGMQMVDHDNSRFPLVDLRPVSNSVHQWVALSVRIDPADPSADDGVSAFAAAFDDGQLLAAIAPLDCIVHVPTAAALTGSLLAKLPPARVVLAIDAVALQQDGALRRLGELQEQGYRMLIDGAAQAGVTLPPTLRAVAHDAATPLPQDAPLAALFGPHLLYHADTPALLEAGGKAGFSWFSGRHALQPTSAQGDDDGGITARRLLKLLGLLLADAETRDIEAELKHDPALCFQLLKLVNSAAFAPSTPIHNFAQAIDRLGRRQLLRWLQLLLFARPRSDGGANPLLPLAALRAAQVESLCKQHGCPRDAQDLSFQVGVFSLLDVLLGMPMQEIVAVLRLPPDSAGALLTRSGTVGGLLALAEAQAPTAAALAREHVTPVQWWQSQLDGYHWAIQVSRNL